MWNQISGQYSQTFGIACIFQQYLQRIEQEAERLEDFKESLGLAVDAVLAGAQLTAEILTDGELSATDFALPFAEQLRSLGPWGQYFPEPLFEGRFVVIEKRVVGGAHLKMLLRPVDGGGSIDAIAFGKLPEDLPDTASVGLIFKLDINHFRGHKTCQLMVENILY